MSVIVAAASPIELAALLRLDLLTARDMVQVCLNWLEQGLDDQAPEIADLAGEIDPRLAEVGPSFERILAALTGAALSRDEALPIALRLHLAAALVQPDERYDEAMSLVIARFAGASGRRLVNHPARLADAPDGTYAEQELGLEYVYGAYWQLDDLLEGEMVVADPATVEVDLRRHLREEVQTLHHHLLALGPERGKVAALVQRLADLPRPGSIEVRDEEPMPERPGLERQG